MKKELIISLLAIVAFAGLYAVETAHTRATLDQFGTEANQVLENLIDAIDDKFEAIDAKIAALEAKAGITSQTPAAATSENP